MKRSKHSQPTTAESGARTMVLMVLSLVLSLAGCAPHKRPYVAPPLILRHCAITSERPGFIACDCMKPLVVWDAQLRRKIYYCDGKTQ